MSLYECMIFLTFVEMRVHKDFDGTLSTFRP